MTSDPEEWILSENDPTDNVLAAIASILDQPESHREPAAVAAEDKPATSVEAIEADGYRKFGPGPIAQIRLKWTVRRATTGEYYVDETVGENSTPIVSGPMTKDAAVRLVDDREGEAQRQFAQLRSEMASGAVGANPVRREGSAT
ncbi:MAG: hypothetical protein WA303_00990 [Bradyrhizobium sp.]